MVNKGYRGEGRKESDPESWPVLFALHEISTAGMDMKAHSGVISSCPRSVLDTLTVWIVIAALKEIIRLLLKAEGLSAAPDSLDRTWKWDLVRDCWSGHGSGHCHMPGSQGTQVTWLFMPPLTRTKINISVQVQRGVEISVSHVLYATNHKRKLLADGQSVWLGYRRKC